MEKSFRTIMNLFDALILGVLQGITEFLPISSSGHLILAENLMHLPVDELKSFDISVHFGTLLAILVYFWGDIWILLKTFALVVTRNKKTTEAKRVRMIQYLVVGTIPAVAVGLFFNDFLDEKFRNPQTVAVMLMIVAGYFVAAELLRSKRHTRDLTWKRVLMIGVAQSVALIPGVSRSGATISTGLLSGLDRHEAARFSFLLGAVAITAATVLSFYKVAKGEFFLPQTDIIVAGVVSSFVSGILAISFLMNFLKKHTLYVFAGYRVLLAGFMIWFFFF